MDSWSFSAGYSKLRTNQLIICDKLQCKCDSASSVIAPDQSLLIHFLCFSVAELILNTKSAFTATLTTRTMSSGSVS